MANIISKSKSLMDKYQSKYMELHLTEEKSTLALEDLYKHEAIPKMDDTQKKIFSSTYNYNVKMKFSSL